MSQTPEEIPREQTQSKSPVVNNDEENGIMDELGLPPDFDVKEQDRWLPIANGEHFLQYNSLTFRFPFSISVVYIIHLSSETSLVDQFSISIASTFKSLSFNPPKHSAWISVNSLNFSHGSVILKNKNKKCRTRSHENARSARTARCKSSSNTKSCSSR